MPLYEFIDDKTGEAREMQYPPPPEGPRIGDTVEADGRQWRRTAGGVCPSDQVKAAMKYPYVSIRNCAWMPGAKHTKEGYAIITSQKHEREFMRRNNLVRD